MKTSSEAINYKAYLNLIRNEAWKRVRKNPHLEFEELVGRGNIAFCLATQTWNPQKSSFGTHLWWQIRHQMDSWIKQEAKKHKDIEFISLDEYEDELIDEHSPGVEESVRFKLALENLESETREVCETLFSSPGEIYDLAKNSIRATQKGLRNYLESKNWSQKRINKAFLSIRNALKSL